jgi:hypothetical protein
VLVLAARSGGVAVAQEKKSGWTFETTPYLWASGLNGTVGVRDRTASIDVSFSTLLENLDGALMVPLEGRSGRWGFGLEYIKLKISNESATPGPLFSEAEFEASQRIIEIGPRYRLIDRVPVALEFLAAARWWSLDNRLILKAEGLPDVSQELDENWVDPVVGARTFVDISGRWLFQTRVDVGGFGVGSKFSWQALGGVAYKFGDSFTLRAGYRHLDVDFEEDNERGFIYDVGTGGLIMGATFKF